MYNHTNGDQKWKQRLEGFITATQRVFFPDPNAPNVMVEYACEKPGNCNKDQRSFKTYLARWLAVATQLAPFTRDRIKPMLEASAIAASKACTNTQEGVACGRNWFEYRDDGTRDVGNQMTALSIIQSNLIFQSKGLADIKSGDSLSDPNAGNKGFVLDHISTLR